MNPLLNVADLAVSFRTHNGKVMAVSNVSFQVFPGEAIGIVGESGCGKSVTAHAIMQLIPQPPGNYEHGKILFQGTDLLQSSEAEMQKIRGNQISMIFQDPMSSLNPVLTVGAQIAETVQLHEHLGKGEAHSRAVELLQLVGIPSPDQRVKHYPHQLSGGMRQRVMIAMALACNPSLLIADEPTTALDVTVQSQILDLMQDLQRKFHTAIILISHDLGVIARICSRVQVMYAGKIVESGTVQDIFYHARHPYTWGLLRSMPRMDSPAKQKLAVIAGQPPDLLKLPEGCSFYPRCPHAMRICIEQVPENVQVSSEHNATCWLLHPHAPTVLREERL